MSTPTRANPRTVASPPSIQRAASQSAVGAPWAAGGDPWEVGRASNQEGWNQPGNGGTAWHTLTPTQVHPRQWHSPAAEGDPYTTAVAADGMDDDDETALQASMEALQEQPLDDVDIGSQSDFQEAENEEGEDDPSVITTRKALQAMLGTLAPGSTGGEVRNAALKAKRPASGAPITRLRSKQGASS